MRRNVVLVTRPEPGLSRTMAEVGALGFEAVACPMLEIVPGEAVEPHVCSAVLVTSGNAVFALAKWPREQRIVAVGEQTAARARAMGFLNVEAAGGDARALEAHCLAQGDIGRDVLLLSGVGYGVGLAESLGARRVEVYSVRKARLLTAEAREALLCGRVEAVWFYSGKTAEAFMEALGEEERAVLGGVRAVCLSEGIAVGLAGTWREVVVRDAGKPVAGESGLG